MDTPADSHKVVKEWGEFEGKRSLWSRSRSSDKPRCNCCGWDLDKETNHLRAWREVVGCSSINRFENRVYIAPHGEHLLGERKFVAVIFLRCPDCSTLFFFPAEFPLYGAIYQALGRPATGR